VPSGLGFIVRKLYRKKPRAQFNEAHVLKLPLCQLIIAQRITIKVAFERYVR
jgi:hypothetical protein